MKTALLVALLAVSAHAERPQTDGPRQFIPVAVSGTGARGTYYVSDVRLLNRSSKSVDVTLIFTPSGSDGRFDFSVAHVGIEPGRIAHFPDIVRTLFDRSGSGSIEVDGDVLLFNAIANHSPAGIYSQSIGIASSSDAIGHGNGSLYLFPVTGPTEKRTNIGLTETAGGSGKVRIGLLTSFQSVPIAEIDLRPWRHVQIPVPLSAGIFDFSFLADVTVTEGDARVLAYASVVDNVTGDAMYIAGTTAPARRAILPVVGTVSYGSNSWLTAMWYDSIGFELNDGTAALTPVTFYPSTTGAAGAIRDVLYNASYGNHEMFSVWGVREDITGHVEVEMPSGALLTTRVWTGYPGTRGQSVDLVPIEAAIGSGSALDALRVETSESFRTNAGVAETAGANAIVRLTLLDADGSNRGEKLISLGPRQHLQLPVTSIFDGNVENGRIRFEVVGGTGRIVGYVSVIANASGDPVMIIAR